MERQRSFNSACCARSAQVLINIIITLIIVTPTSATPTTKTFNERMHDMIPPLRPIRKGEDLIMSAEDPMLTRREPKWADACNRRASLNDSLISVIINPQNRHPAHIIERDPSKLGRFARLNKAASKTHSEASQEGQRNKRSIYVVGGKHDWPSADDRMLQQANSVIVFKQPKLESRFGLKKTSFALAPSWPQIMGGNQHKTSLARSKNRYLVGVQQSVGHQLAFSEGESNSKTTEMQHRQPDEAIGRLVESIYASDIKLSWYINCALNTANSMLRLLNSPGKQQTLPGEQLQSIGGPSANQTSGEQLEEHRSWLPSLESLIRRRQVDEFQVIESGKLLTNVSHYFQFFAVALEQMIFEQVSLKNRQLVVGFREFERATLKILCESENIVRLLDTLESQQKELIQLIAEKGLSWLELRDSVSRLRRSALDSMEKRIHYGKGMIELLDSPHSPTAGRNATTATSESYRPVKLINSVNDSTSSNLMIIQREVMPLSQRKLTSQVDRNARDRLIFSDLFKLVTYYKSVLANLYI